MRALRLPALVEELLAPARHAETVQLFRAALFEAQAAATRAAPEGGLDRGAAASREPTLHTASAATSARGDAAGAGAGSATPAPENGASDGRSGSDGVGAAHDAGRPAGDDSTGREGVSLLRALLMLQQQASSAAS
jgi:hypothetical protein